MTSINPNFGINSGVFFQPRETKPIESEPNILTQGGGLDTVTFSTNQSEKFWVVRNELAQNVPDRTTTIEEKELAIKYIDRMLACNDIPQDAKEFWTKQKSVIEMEIQAIKNENAIQTTKDGDGEKIADVWKEFMSFVGKYQGKFSKNLSVKDRSEYLITYNKTCLTFIDRLLICSDINDSLKAEYQRMYQNHIRDMNNANIDLRNAEADKKRKEQE